MNIAKKSVKFSFDFSNAQISPMTINGCGRYNLENVAIPLVGYTLSMDGDTFDGHCDGEISFTYLDIDDILEKLKIVGTDSYFDQEYERIRQRIIQEGRQRYGDDFDQYEDADRSELNDFELNYSSLTQRMWDNLKLDIKSAKLSKFTLTGKWSSWDDSPDVDEWKEGIKGSITVDITDADGNTYRDIKVKFDESTAFVFGEEAFDYMESAIYSANERDDEYMANTKKSRPIRKEHGDEISEVDWNSEYSVSKSMNKASPYTLDWCGDKLFDAYQILDTCFMSNYTSSHHSFFNSMLSEYGVNSHTIIQALRHLIKEIKVRPISEVRSTDYMASTKKSMSVMKSKGEKMKSKSSIVKNKKVKYHRWSSTAYDIWDALKVIDEELYDKYWDNAPDNHWTEKESNLYHQIDDGLNELESAVNRYYDLLSDADYSASAKKSKVSKSQISKRFAKSYIKRIMAYSKLSKMEKSKLKKAYNGWENHSTWAFMLHWGNDPYLANLPYELIENGEVESYQELQNRIYDEIDMLIDSIKEELQSLSPITQDICGFAVEQVNTHQCMNAIMDEAEYHNTMASYSASAKKSKREILKAKVDELLEEEDDDEIAKPRMKDMFLDSKRKSRKSTKSNDEKGEDADEYREESDGDDVSDSKVMKPEDANDNEDENEAPSGGNSSLPEDADGQENQSTKKKRMSKFSVTAGGSQRYDGRQNYNQSPMMREAIDRFKTEKDLVKSLQDRVDEINGARKNTEVNNKSPLRIKGRY